MDHLSIIKRHQTPEKRAALKNKKGLKRDDQMIKIVVLLKAVSKNTKDGSKKGHPDRVPAGECIVNRGGWT